VKTYQWLDLVAPWDSYNLEELTMVKVDDDNMPSGDCHSTCMCLVEQAVRNVPVLESGGGHGLDVRETAPIRGSRL
jgi:hypothetical protein